MKRSVLLKKLEEVAKAKGLELEFVRHGANHDIYRIGAYSFPVARHADINERTAKGTIREVEKS